MKFTTKFLTLLAATSVFSYNVQNKLNKRIEINLDKVGEVAKCTTSLDRFKECKIDIQGLRTNKDNVCNSINSEKCQQILKGGINMIPECQNVPKEFLIASPIFFQLLSSSIALACSKDEKGQYCPLSDVIISTDGKLNRNDKVVADAVEQTCKSAKCTQAAVNTLTNIETGELLMNLAGVKTKRQIDQSKAVNTNDYKEVLEYFKSENCTNQSKPKAEANDAVTTKYNSILLITLGLLLTILF